MYPSFPSPSRGETTHLPRSWWGQTRGRILPSLHIATLCLVSQGGELREGPGSSLPTPPPPMVTSSYSSLNEGSLSGWRQPKTLGHKRAGTREKKGFPTEAADARNQVQLGVGEFA